MDAEAAPRGPAAVVCSVWPRWAGACGGGAWACAGVRAACAHMCVGADVCACGHVNWPLAAEPRGGGPTLASSARSCAFFLDKSDRSVLSFVAASSSLRSSSAVLLSACDDARAVQHRCRSSGMLLALIATLGARARAPARTRKHARTHARTHAHMCTRQQAGRKAGRPAGTGNGSGPVPSGPLSGIRLSAPSAQLRAVAPPAPAAAKGCCCPRGGRTPHSPVLSGACSAATRTPPDVLFEHL
jgi:hypothetical protein